MPIDPVLGGVIGGGLGILGSVINAQNQREMNDQNWIRQAQMYQTERNDALADRDFNNAYNSPAAQMARLKAAGLNPNLMYGQATQASTSQMPRGASPGGPQGIAPKIDLGSIGQSFVQMYQMGVMQAQQKALDARAVLDTSKTQFTDVLTKLGEAKVPFASGMASTALDIAKAQREKIFQEGNLIWKNLQLLNDTYDQKVEQSLYDTLIKHNILGKSQEEINLLKLKVTGEGFVNDVKEFQSNMAKAGINPNSPQWMTLLFSILKKWDILPDFMSPWKR